MGQKDALLEYFKADNALLQNSLMYVTHTVHVLSTDATARDSTWAAALGTLSNAMLQFIRTPQPQLRGEITGILQHISTAPPLQQERRLLAAHGHLIVDLLPKVDTTLRQLLIAPTTVQARALRHASLQYHSQIEARAQLFRVFLYAVAVILLAYLAYLFTRLRANTRDLEQANADLHRDITERKRLEEKTRQQERQLIQANKMTALGTLVAGVAHEVNNPNHLVLMNARVLAESWTDALRILDAYHHEHGEFLLGGLPYTEMRDTVPALIRDIHDGALRIERIVDNLKDFARPRSQTGQTMMQLNDAVQRALTLLQHLIDRHTACFRTDLAAHLPLLRGNVQQVEQIVVNLVVNALEALPEKERGVTVATRHNHTESCLELDVCDEGVGIPQAHLDRLCDPFFTTKQDQRGTSLGLAITYTLVCDHGGSLTFTSTPGQGTRALVKLPVPAAPPLAADAQPTSPLAHTPYFIDAGP